MHFILGALTPSSCQAFVTGAAMNSEQYIFQKAAQCSMNSKQFSKVFTQLQKEQTFTQWHKLASAW